MDNNAHPDLDRKINIARELSEFQKKLNEDQLKALNLEDLFRNSHRELNNEDLKDRIATTISNIVELETQYNKKIKSLENKIQKLQNIQFPPKEASQGSSSERDLNDG